MYSASRLVSMNISLGWDHLKTIGSRWRIATSTTNITIGIFLIIFVGILMPYFCLNKNQSVSIRVIREIRGRDYKIILNNFR